MNRTNVIFCAASLVVSLLVAMVAFPVASLTSSQLEASRTVTSAEEMGEIDLGEFGKVMVLELVDYYLENPPVTAAGEAPIRKVRFQGC